MSNQHNPANPGGWGLSICPPVITDCQRRQRYERVVARGREIVDRPDSDSLQEYHRLLTRTFGVGEVEPLEKLQNELASNHEAGAKEPRGVKGEPRDLQQASEEFRGHCLALILLGNLLCDYYQGDISKRGEVRGLLEDEDRRGGHAWCVMDS
jgi:hypothetical protein